jgi:hypothetical protein
MEMSELTAGTVIGRAADQDMDLDAVGAVKRLSQEDLARAMFLLDSGNYAGTSLRAVLTELAAEDLNQAIENLRDACSTAFGPSASVEHFRVTGQVRVMVPEECVARMASMLGGEQI